MRKTHCGSDSFRPANNSPSHRHWPLRASHVSFYSALFLRNLRPAPRRSAFGGGFNRHIIRPGREIARKIFPRSGLPFWTPCRLLFSLLPGPPVSLSSRTPSVSLSGGGQKKEETGPDGSVSLGDVRGMPYLAGASSAALASAAALAFSAWAFLMALYFSFSSAVATGKMASLGQTLVQSLQPTHLS